MKDITEILLGKINGKPLTLAQEELFKEWISNPDNKREYKESLLLRNLISASQPRNGKSKNAILGEIKKSNTSQKWYWWFSAVAAVCCVMLGSYYLLNRQMDDINIITNKQITLTLTGGEQVSLSERNTLSENLIAKDAIVEWKADEQLDYKESTISATNAYHTLTIPIGCEYRLVLQDGTRVWLNANTEFRYPVTFVGEQREVYVKGEAYFEVEKDSLRPFFVHCGEVTTQVLGTSFNVRNYSGMPLSTTLVSGSVETIYKNNRYRINPGEQFSCDGGVCVVECVNVDPIIAWRHGNFMFKECRLEDLLSEIARWYDLQLFYQNTALKDEVFTATFSRSLEPDALLDILSKTRKATFSLNGKTLLISN